MENAEKHTITLTRITIRESISILLFKVVALDFIAATLTIVYFSLVSFTPNNSIAEQILSYHVLFFVLLGAWKILFTSYVILLWINEYYELTPNEILHRKGIIKQSQQSYKFDYVRTIKMSQNLLGRFFNYGTIELQDIRKNKRVELYLIHNPHKYLHILEKLINEPHEEKREFKPHFFEEEKDEVDEENKPKVDEWQVK